MIISYADFISNIPESACIAPELNKTNLITYIELCKKYNVKNVLNRPIYKIGNEGFALTPDFWNLTLEIPIYHQTCHPYIPWTFQQIQELAPTIFDLCVKLKMPFAPESITFKGIPPSTEYVAKLNSRRTILHKDFQSTLASLNTKRRYKVKQALNQLDGNYIVCTANEDMLEPISKILREKYEDNLEYEYAFIQSLWAVACEATCIKLIDNSAYAFFIERDYGLQHNNETAKEMMFQAIIQNKDNTGAQLLSAALLEFSGKYQFLEPTCKVIFEDSSIDIYKRLVTNADNYVDMLCIGTKEQCKHMYPPYYIDNKWVSN